MDKPMEKYGSIPSDAACESCGGKGCEACESTGRKYKCHICNEWRCEHLGNQVKEKEEKEGRPDE